MKAFNTQKYLLQINLITLANHVKRDSNRTILEFKEVEDNNLLRLQATINDKFLPAFLQTQPPVNAYTVLGWFQVSITKNNLENSLLLEPEIPNSSLGNFLQKNCLATILAVQFSYFVQTSKNLHAVQT